MRRNKSLYPLLIVLFLCLAPVFAICAQAEVSGDYTYKIVDGAAIITRYDGDETEVIIPSALGGFSVTQIGASAFESCGHLETITLPEGVMQIGDRAFADCELMKTVTLPKSLLVIGRAAFTYNRSLAAIDLPGGLCDIGESAFDFCDTLTQIRIPASVKNIGYRAFSWCGQLQNIQVEPQNETYSSLEGVLYNKAQTALIAYPVQNRDHAFAIPASVSVIENFAFYGCRLEEITIPESVTHIGDSAFEFCYMLKSLFIPAGVKSVGDRALNGCDGLTSIDVSPGSLLFTSIDGILYDKAMAELIKYPARKEGKDFTVPSTVKRISSLAFLRNYALESITLPDGLESIGANAFTSCRNLTSLTIPDSVTGIERCAFLDCKKLISVKLPDGIKTIAEAAFYDDRALKTVLIPDSVISIDKEAFAFCGALESITIMNSVTSIGDQAFTGCELLTIHGVPGSAAQTYADANGIPFEGI